MARFSYKVRDGAGELATGVIAAGALEEAAQLLRGEGKFVVKLAPAKKTEISAHDSADEVSGGVTSGGKRKRIKRAEVITFVHQMAVMVDTGVPLSEALECVADQALNENFKKVLNDVAEQVNAGNDFSSALEAHPKVFPSVMVSLMQASEVSGTMGMMLERVSSYLGKELATAKKIRGALMYPAFMLLMLIGVTVFLLTFVLPRFAAIYQSRESALPAPTQLLITLSDTIIYQWYMILGGLVAAVVGWRLFARSSIGRYAIDSAKLHMPVIGPLFNKLYITRACRTMGTMIAAGVPILDMVSISRNVTHNRLFQNLWDDVDEKLRRGSQLSDALFASPLIPRGVSQMVYSGEKSGRLGPVMEKIAEFTETEFDEQVKVSTQFIEPALIGAMGIIVGFVAIALLLPIFTIGRVVSGH
jgi:type IV pilus assembly protein PilC